ncbi:hypothetical protein QTP88_026988 [Uroleucon formosanum]
MTIGRFSKRLKGTRIIVAEMFIVYLALGCWEVDEVLTQRRLLVGVKFTYLLEFLIIHHEQKKMVDKEIIHLLEISSGSEDGFEIESDVENDKVDLWNEYANLLDEPNLEEFEKVLSEQFNTETILDD